MFCYRGVTWFTHHVILFSEDNESGVGLGKRIGRQAWRKALMYFRGGEERGDDDDGDDD
jgi:hypothetical protein